jgi:hypothetical protein
MANGEGEGPRNSVVSTTLTAAERERLEKFAWDARVKVARLLYVVLAEATQGFRDFSILERAGFHTPAGSGEAVADE